MGEEEKGVTEWGTEWVTEWVRHIPRGINSRLSGTFAVEKWDLVSVPGLRTGCPDWGGGRESHMRFGMLETEEWDVWDSRMTESEALQTDLG